MAEPLTKIAKGKRVELTPEQETAFYAQAEIDDNRPLTDRELKLQGVEIEGVMCSATREDQNGLTAIAVGIGNARAAGVAFPDTVFEFENGNELTITDANFDAVYAAWVPFRQSFFAA